MFKENKILESLLRFGRRVIPRRIFNFFQPAYHRGLSLVGASAYRWPSRSMKVIGVTGTKGKSTTVYMITKVLEELGLPVAALGSLGIKIRDQEWPNTLKMTMPGRFKMQKFIYQARKAGCQYVVLEVTSEGLKQMRHVGVNFDCAVFTNLSPEHIENHGTFENYMKAKQKLFQVTRNIHVINSEDPYMKDFNKFQPKKKILYGLSHGDVTQEELQVGLQLAGGFNSYNALAALAVVKAYGLDMDKAKQALEKIESISGRMEFVSREPVKVVVDYAHTPDSLELVYKNLKPDQPYKLICILGAAGGGRDKWKRPIFGEIAGRYCDEIILANEDPYDEDPQRIIDEVRNGIPKEAFGRVKEIMDRRHAIKEAINSAQPGDTVIITGKGSETSIAVAGGKKIAWSDKEEVEKYLTERDFQT